MLPLLALPLRYSCAQPAHDARMNPKMVLKRKGEAEIFTSVSEFKAKGYAARGKQHQDQQQGALLGAQEAAFTHLK